MPLTDHLQLTQFLSTIGKRKKREAEAKLEPPTLSRQDAEMGSRIFNISGNISLTFILTWKKKSPQLLGSLYKNTYSYLSNKRSPKIILFGKIFQAPGRY